MPKFSNNLSVLMIFCCYSIIFSNQTDTTSKKPHIQFHGNITGELGRIPDFFIYAGFGDNWYKAAYCYLTTDFIIKATDSRRLSLLVDLKGEGRFIPGYSFKHSFDDSTALSVYLNSAYGKIGNAEPDSSKISLSFGLFQHRYGYSYQTFGDYLFYAGVYPGYIRSRDYDEILTGAHLFVNKPSWLFGDIFITLETKSKPLNALSLSYTLRYNSNRVFDFLVGAQHYRFLTPSQAQAEYEQTTVRLNVSGDLLAPEGNSSGYYTSAGMKLVLRTSIMPFVLLKSSIPTVNNLRFFSESAILGLRNQGDFYNKIEERIPVLAGISFPIGKILDVLCFEVEWYGSRWRNVYPDSSSLPIPYYSYNYRIDGGAISIKDPVNENAGSESESDNLKWALRFNRLFYKSFLIDIKFGSDHFTYTYPRNETGKEDLFHSIDEWYMRLLFSASF
jgi:hypothetical protein